MSLISIPGNESDEDPLRHQLHCREIISATQVEIYKPIRKVWCCATAVGMSVAEKAKAMSNVVAATLKRIVTS
jgi:hypothetical protein